MLWAAKRLKVPSILHVMAPLTKREVRKHRCGSADCVAAISKRICNNLISGGVSSDKVVRIDDSVDVEVFSPERRRSNVLREEYQCDGEMLIGIVGRIDAFKRQLDFLKAAREIMLDGNKHVKFFIIGGVHRNSYFQKMRQFVDENGMKEYVRFTGYRRDMADVISSLDILVSLSGGSVMFEAMAAGKAVISAGFSTKETSVHIQDGKTGLLVESKEIKPLSDAMRSLINNQELRVRLGNGARHRAVKELTHVKMAAKTQEMYDLLIDGRNVNK
jgi:glycosyltransferase involved in cell wall biosynthesis